MTQASTKRPALLPERHQDDFFVCDVLDAVPKGDVASMEYPVFSLSTKPDMRTRRYEHNDKFMEVKPSAEGLATVHDRDILIYCISKLMKALNDGQQISQVVRFKAHDLLKATNRMTNGQGYEALKDAFKRLSGTRIDTNVVTGGVEEFETFGLIERAKIVRETRDGRMQDVEVKLSDWVFHAIEQSEVLTLHRDYFRLRKPLERRIYEIARKHCGYQTEWKISLERLHQKVGSASTAREFRRLVGNICDADAEHHHMPDYAVRLNDDHMVVFTKRSSMPHCSEAKSDELAVTPDLKAETYELARQEAPGWDIYLLEQEWRDWITEPPRFPDAAFIGFCRKWFERRGTANG